MTKIIIQEDWHQALGDIFNSIEMTKISKGIDFAIEKHGIESIYPNKELIFRAFGLTPLCEVRAVMIGVEPLADTASGLFLESTETDDMSEQMKKVFAVYCKDYPNNFNTNLMSGVTSHWARQGVLMLNLSLSARAGQPQRHLDHWAFLMNKVLEVLKSSEKPIAFIPFGKTPTDTVMKLLTLPHSHRGFQFKEGIFIGVNKWLKDVGRGEIEW